jgi:hypothetical protein
MAVSIITGSIDGGDANSVTDYVADGGDAASVPSGTVDGGSADNMPPPSLPPLMGSL